MTFVAVLTTFVACLTWCFRRSQRESKPCQQTERNIIVRSESVKSNAIGTSILHVIRTRPRSFFSGANADAKRLRSLEPPFEPSVPIVDDVESSLNMAQVNGLFKEQSPLSQEAPRPGRVISASMMRSAALTPFESAPTIEPAWSSAVGHASTGKSGRVIEKLQAEIDRLRRENQLIKVQFEEVEKANETLATRNQYLQDRNSNFEASHEANTRQLDRKERQVQDLREELKREKERTARAEERATIASANEEKWKDEASQAKAMAQQKEAEYDAIVSCRNMDNDRHQGGLDRIKANFNNLMLQREDDVEKYKKLQIIAEQQRKTIHQLEQLTQKLTANFKAYRSEIDSAIEGLRKHAGKNNEAVSEKLREMEAVTGQMKWIVNVEQVVNHKHIPPRPISRRDEGASEPTVPQRSMPSSPARTFRESVDLKGKQVKKKLSRGPKS